MICSDYDSSLLRIVVTTYDVFLHVGVDGVAAAVKDHEVDRGAVDLDGGVENLHALGLQKAAERHRESVSEAVSASVYECGNSE